MTPGAAAAEFAASHGYWAGDAMPDGRCAFLIPRIWSVDICLGDAPTEEAGISDLYTYPTAALAIAAWEAWRSSSFEGEPVLWVRHQPSNRRRVEGDPATEFVAP